MSKHTSQPRPQPAPQPRSPLQIATSLLNSKKSTGPTTEEGKAVSSLNAVIHGLSSRFNVQDWESEDEYRELYTGFESQFPPHSGFEKELLDALVNSRWLVRRAIFLQEFTFDIERPGCADTKLLELYMRYQNTHERAFQKAHTALLKQRFEREKHAQELRRRELARQVSFVSHQRKEAAEARQIELHTLAVHLKNTAIRAQETRILEREQRAASAKSVVESISVADSLPGAPEALKTAA